jgi:RNA polymerase sigma factor for flagellar operon FliA
MRAYREAESTRTESERDAEIIRHLPLVHSVVDRVAATLPPNVDRDDCFHAGVLGLIDAVDRFDASRDNAFSTYAVLRIRGAIIDELRARDWIPRGARNRAKEYQQAVANLHSRLGRLPDDAELASELGVEVDDLPEIERSAHLHNQISLDTPVGENGSLQDLVGNRKREHDPGQNLDREDRLRLLTDVLSSLKEQERLVIKLYYFEELLMKEIAQVLGVTESRVCQIHARLMSLLRLRLLHSGLEV